MLHLKAFDPNARYSLVRPGRVDGHDLRAGDIIPSAVGERVVRRLYELRRAAVAEVPAPEPTTELPYARPIMQPTSKKRNR